MNWYKALFSSRKSALERKLNEFKEALLLPFKNFKRKLRHRYRWIFELTNSLFLFPLIAVYILIGAAGLIEVYTARRSETGKGIIYPYYSRGWDAIGGVMDFSKDGFYEFLYWTAGGILLFGLFLLYATLSKDKDTAYADGQLTASEPVPVTEDMPELDLVKELNDIMHVLYEVYPRPLEDWAQDLVKSGDEPGEYVIWRRLANTYQSLATSYPTIEQREAMFWTLKLYMDGTRRPGKIRRVLQKDGHSISSREIKKIIIAYEEERDRLFLRI